MDALPTILLGLRTVVKEDLRASPAEMLYGTSLRLPGEFFVSSNININETQFLTRFRQQISNVKPVPASNHSKQDVFIHPELAKCKFVFVRVDAVQPPLKAPYEGPYEVLERTEKYFKLRWKGKPTNISMDRLKPAFVIEGDVPTPANIKEDVPTTAEMKKDVPTPTKMKKDVPTPTKSRTDERPPVFTRYGRRVQFRTP